MFEQEKKGSNVTYHLTRFDDFLCYLTLRGKDKKRKTRWAVYCTRSSECSDHIIIKKSQIFLKFQYCLFPGVYRKI